MSDGSDPIQYGKSISGRSGEECIEMIPVGPGEWKEGPRRFIGHEVNGHVCKPGSIVNVWPGAEGTYLYQS